MKYKVTRQSRKHQLGFNLLELMVSIGIMGGLTMIISPFIFRQVEESEIEKIAMTRIMLQMQVERVLSNTRLKAYSENTLGANPALSSCATKTGICQAVTNQGFSVYDASNTLVAGPSAANPARFDVTGMPCVSGNRCLFEIYSNYTASCLQGAATCAEASSVTASYTIQQNPEIHLYKGPAMKPVVSPPIPIMTKISKTPPFKITRYSTGGVLGTHEFCMIQSLDHNFCSLNGSYKQIWTASGSCFATVCFDFL